MQRIFLLVVLTALLACPAFARKKSTAEAAALKARQEQEVRALKFKQKYMRNSLDNSDLPRIVRVQLRHELKRQQRKLRQRQKDERQELKDRRRLLKAEMQQSGML